MKSVNDYLLHEVCEIEKDLSKRIEIQDNEFIDDFDSLPDAHYDALNHLYNRILIMKSEISKS